MDEGREGHCISASTTPPVPINDNDAASECSDAMDNCEDYLRDPLREDEFSSCKRELRQLRNRLAAKDQKMSEHHLEVQRHKLIKKESAKVAGELHKARSLLQEEQGHLKESRAQVEHYRSQAEQYKAQVEQLQRAFADASAANAAAAAELKQVKAHEVELEEELKNSRATVEDLRSKLEALRKSHEQLEAQAAQAVQAAQSASSQSQLSPKLQGSAVSAAPAAPASTASRASTAPAVNGKSPASARPAKNIRMVPTNGSIDLVRDDVTRFTESPASSVGAGPAPSKLREVEMPKSGRQKSVLFSNMEGAHQSTVGKVHLPGYGITDGASTLAKVLLSRIHFSVYAPGYRRQPYQQMGMPMMAQNGMQQMQANHIVQVPVQPAGLPAGGHMPVHGMNVPTQG